MKLLSDILLALFIITITFGPLVLLAVYGYRRGARAFKEKLGEVQSPLQARWKLLGASFGSAIIPAFAALFGSTRSRAAAGHDEDTAWQCVFAVGVILLVFVIVPFVVGVQRSYVRVGGEIPRS